MGEFHITFTYHTNKFKAIELAKVGFSDAKCAYNIDKDPICADKSLKNLAIEIQKVVKDYRKGRQ